jgi:hypothetical protein
MHDYKVHNDNRHKKNNELPKHSCLSAAAHSLHIAERICGAAKLMDCKAHGLQGSPTARLTNCKAHQLQGSQEMLTGKLLWLLRLSFACEATLFHWHGVAQWQFVPAAPLHSWPVRGW